MVQALFAVINVARRLKESALQRQIIRILADIQIYFLAALL